MVVRVRSSPFRTLTNGNPELSTLTSDIPLGYLNSHKRNPELSTLKSDIRFPGTNSHIRKSELRTLTSDIPSGASTHRSVSSQFDYNALRRPTAALNDRTSITVISDIYTHVK